MNSEISRQDAPHRKQVTFDDIEARLTDQSGKARYDWFRQIIGLSAGALTLSISLQNQYLPKVPKEPWLLKWCWVLLAISVLAGMLALHGEGQTPLDAVNHLRRMRRTVGDAAAADAIRNVSYFSRRPIYKWSEHLLIVGFSAAAVFFGWFAVLNLQTG